MVTSAQRLKHVRVSSEEVLKYDRMIREHIEKEIIKYWANGSNPHSLRTEVNVGRLGMSVDDLMQVGREFVIKQLRWFKTYGYDENGNIKNAKESTMMYAYLKHKFQSLSRTYANSKHGGQIVNIEEHKERLQTLADTIRGNSSLSVDDCDRMIVEVLKTCQQEVQKMVRSGLYGMSGMRRERFNSTHSIADFLSSKVGMLETTLHTSYEDIDEFDAASFENPESNLLAIESVVARYGDAKEEVESPTPHRRVAHPNFNPKGTSFLVLVLARKMGIRTQSELAKHLGVSVATLSNVLHDRSQGTDILNKKLHDMFGKTVRELRQLVSTEK